MKKRRTGLISTIIWTVITVVWAFIACMNIFSGQTWGWQMVLQSACVLVSGANAVVGFVKYKRSANNEEQQ